MIATMNKSLNVHKAQSRGSNPRRSKASTGSNSRGRPVTKLRTIDETAELFGTSSRSVRRLIASGALPAIRLGRCVRIADDDIAAFLAANRSV
jgi:excisionase family DNA binding protein